jgi:hypothetical protein
LPKDVAWPLQKTIAEVFGIQVRQVQNHVDELVSLGLVRKVKVGRKVGYQMWFTIDQQAQSITPIEDGQAQSAAPTGAIHYAPHTQSIAPPSERELKERERVRDCQLEGHELVAVSPTLRRCRHCRAKEPSVA